MLTEIALKKSNPAFASYKFKNDRMLKCLPYESEPLGKVFIFQRQTLQRCEAVLRKLSRTRQKRQLYEVKFNFRISKKIDAHLAL